MRQGVNNRCPFVGRDDGEEITMIDYYLDPPEPIEPPECCGEDMEIEGDAAVCLKCGKRFEPEPEVDEPYIEEAFYIPELPAFAACPHGKETDCNACDVASDLAYDAARERRYR